MFTKNKSIYKHLDFMLMDYALLILSFLIAYISRIGSLSTLLDTGRYRLLVMLMILVNIVVDFFYEPYKNILRRSYLKEIKEVLVYVLLNLLLISLIVFLAKLGTFYSRLASSFTYIYFGLLSYIFRQFRKNYLNNRNKSSIVHSNKKMLVITDKKNIDKLLDKVKNYNYERYEIIGLAFIDEDRKGEEVEGYKVIANKEDVLSYICHNWVDEVFMAMSLNSVPREILEGLAVAGVTTNILIRKLDEFQGQEQTIRKILNSNVLTTGVRQRNNYQIFMKRLMDIIGGIVGSVIALLLAVIIGPIIKLKSPGPIFYRQERIGLNGRHFNMYKFRSMRTDADDLKESLMAQNIITDGMMFKVKDDPRIIPGIGEFIRKTSIDEFPQFFNVVRGEMSLVGTRPPTVDEWIKYKLEHRIRMAIKPGITGLWQVNGRSKITDFNKVIEYDTKYINNWNLALDVEILLKTIKIMFSKREDEAM